MTDRELLIEIYKAWLKALIERGSYDGKLEFADVFQEQFLPLIKERVNNGYK